MEFVWLNKQGVASDEGFVLQRVERFYFEYREANRRMRLNGESIVSGLGGASFGLAFIQAGVMNHGSLHSIVYQFPLMIASVL